MLPHQGVASRAEGIIGFAVVKNTGGLAFSDGQLGADFSFAGAIFGILCTISLPDSSNHSIISKNITLFVPYQSAPSKLR